MINVEHLGRWEDRDGQKYVIFRKSGFNAFTQTYGSVGFEADGVITIDEADLEYKLTIMRGTKWVKVPDEGLLSEGESGATSSFLGWITI